jgi:hypothetical protein
VSAINESLGDVLRIAGVRRTALIDLGTGMVVASAGETGAGFPAAAASVASATQSAVRTYELTGSRGDLQEITLTTPGLLHLTKVLEYRRGDGLVLYVDVDLSKTNMALAGLQIEQLAAGLLAR